MSTSLILGVPPSANEFYGAWCPRCRRPAMRHKSTKAKKWLERAELAVAVQKPEELLTGPTYVTADVYLKSTRRGDLDNIIKPTLDVLTGAVYPDDRYVDFVGFWKHKSDRSRVEITVHQEMPDLPFLEALGKHPHDFDLEF